MRIGVVGFGNILFGDDGAGVEVVRRLEGLLDGVELIDGGTSAMEVPLHTFDALVIVDAASLPGVPEGEVVVFEKEELLALPSGVKLSGHSLSVLDHLRLLEFSGELPEVLFLVALSCKRLSLGASLSPACEKAVDAAVKKVVELVEDIKAKFRRLGASDGNVC